MAEERSPSAGSRVIRFGSCELRPDARTLRRNGKNVPAQKRVLELLCYLIDHRDRTLSKAELHDALWCDTHVTDAALTQAVKQLRRAVGDDGDRQAVIQTARGLGYRFVGDVEETTENDPTPDPADAFIGRHDLLVEVDEMLGRLQRGRSGILLVSGEPGIGKSRLLSEIGERATRNRLSVLAGRCVDDEGAPPLWPWIQVLRDVLRHPDAVSAEIEPLRATVARAIPELRPYVASGPIREAWQLDAAEDQFRLFDAVTRLLSAAAPGVLLLDDLHAADGASLRLLEHVCRYVEPAGLLVVATHRPIELETDEGRRAVAASIARESRARAVELRGFGREEIASYVCARGHATPTSTELDALEQATRGNPFFLAQIVRLSERDELGRLDALPPTLREAVARHVDFLSPATHALLVGAALIGREFRPALALALGDAPPSRPFDAALAAGILEPSPTTPGSLRFAHSLIHDALVQSLSPERRRELHERLTDVLEGSAETIDGRRAALAHHAYEAALLGGDPRKAVECLLDAADECARRLAYDMTAEHLERALPLLERTDPDRAVDVRMQLAAAWLRANEAARAISIYASIAEQALELGRPELLARAALAHEDAGWEAGDPYVRDPAAIRYLDAARQVLTEGAIALRADLCSRLARRRYYERELDEAKELARAGADLAARVADPVLEAQVHASLAHVLWHPEDREERVAAAYRAVEAALRGDEIGPVLRAYNQLLLVLTEVGDLDSARDALHEAESLQNQVRWVSPWMRWLVRLHRGGLAQLEGHFARAERSLSDLDSLTPSVKRADAPLLARSQRFMLRWWQGRATEEAEFLQTIEGLPRVSPAFPAMAASCWAAMGRREDARRCYGAALGYGLEAASALASPSTLGGLGLACIELEDREHAPALYAKLQLWQGHPLVVRPGASYFGLVDRVLGGLARVSGNFEAALRHYTSALEWDLRVGAAPWAALDRLEVARLSGYGGATVPETHPAREHLEKARRAGIDLGSPLILQKAARVAEELGVDLEACSASG